MKKKKLKRSTLDHYDCVLQELRMYEKRGATITLSGEKLPLEDIAKACVIHDPGGYMGDFIWNDRGELSEIRYDKVSMKTDGKKKNRS